MREIHERIGRSDINDPTAVKLRDGEAVGPLTAVCRVYLNGKHAPDAIEAQPGADGWVREERPCVGHADHVVRERRHGHVRVIEYAPGEDVLDALPEGFGAVDVRPVTVVTEAELHAVLDEDDEPAGVPVVVPPTSGQEMSLRPVAKNVLAWYGQTLGQTWTLTDANTVAIDGTDTGVDVLDALRYESDAPTAAEAVAQLREYITGNLPPFDEPSGVPVETCPADDGALVESDLDTLRQYLLCKIDDPPMPESAATLRALVERHLATVAERVGAVRAFSDVTVEAKGDTFVIDAKIDDPALLATLQAAGWKRSARGIYRQPSGARWTAPTGGGEPEIGDIRAREDDTLETLVAPGEWVRIAGTERGHIMATGAVHAWTFEDDASAATCDNCGAVASFGSHGSCTYKEIGGSARDLDNPGSFPACPARADDDCDDEDDPPDPAALQRIFDTPAPLTLGDVVYVRLPGHDEPFFAEVTKAGAAPEVTVMGPLSSASGELPGYDELRRAAEVISSNRGRCAMVDVPATGDLRLRDDGELEVYVAPAPAPMECLVCKSPSHAWCTGGRHVSHFNATVTIKDGAVVEVKERTVITGADNRPGVYAEPGTKPCGIFRYLKKDADGHGVESYIDLDKLITQGEPEDVAFAVEDLRPDHVVSIIRHVAERSRRGIPVVQQIIDRAGAEKRAEFKATLAEHVARTAHAPLVPLDVDVRPGDGAVVEDATRNFDLAAEVVQTSPHLRVRAIPSGQQIEESVLWQRLLTLSGLPDGSFKADVVAALEAKAKLFTQHAAEVVRLRAALAALLPHAEHLGSMVEGEWGALSGDQLDALDAARAALATPPALVAWRLESLTTEPGEAVRAVLASSPAPCHVVEAIVAGVPVVALVGGAPSPMEMQNVRDALMRDGAMTADDWTRLHIPFHDAASRWASGALAMAAARVALHKAEQARHGGAVDVRAVERLLADAEAVRAFEVEAVSMLAVLAVAEWDKADAIRTAMEIKARRLAEIGCGATARVEGRDRECRVLLTLDGGRVYVLQGAVMEWRRVGVLSAEP